ncbi:hypothetical protein FOL47_004489 [Perkinsus chesapeaki]|uniref:Uncharacterized protein n=1 Tax=Perkinsus chesapeaki TaxID=330153 RepID=A0A7J6M2D8_PERCH|nr:hypothetical protein FOL47_004489 [Perkinsus chesapeaki]
MFAAAAVLSSVQAQGPKVYTQQITLADTLAGVALLVIKPDEQDPSQGFLRIIIIGLDQRARRDVPYHRVQNTLQLQWRAGAREAFIQEVNDLRIPGFELEPQSLQGVLEVGDDYRTFLPVTGSLARPFILTPYQSQAAAYCTAE